MPYKNKEDKKENNRLYYINNKERCDKLNEQWRINNPDKIKKYSEQWEKNGVKWKRNYNKEWMRNERKTNLKFNLNCKMSIGICKSLKGNKNNRKWEDLVGYTLNDLIKRLKRTMPKGYTWKDYLEGKLHIDHKIPKSVFNFTKPEHFDFKRCWALENLRLLLAKENLIKHNKLSNPFQLTLEIG